MGVVLQICCIFQHTFLSEHFLGSASNIEYIFS